MRKAKWLILVLSASVPLSCAYDVKHQTEVNLIDLDAVSKMTKARDVAGLKSISKETSQVGCLASYHVSALSDAADAVAFCRSLKCKSPLWVNALMGLEVHPEDDAVVLPYLVELMKLDDKEINFYCYKLCHSLKWPELRSFAVDDIGCTCHVYYANQPQDELTVGMMAQKYVYGKVSDKHGADTIEIPPFDVIHGGK